MGAPGGTPSQLFDLFFANPEFQEMVLDYLSGTYDEFRREVAV